ncbi:transposase [Streptomyces sp. CB00271]|nr:transposase [Streptomyces sp. CB00271]
MHLESDGTYGVPRITAELRETGGGGCPYVFGQGRRPVGSGGRGSGRAVGMGMGDSQVTIELTADEALVLSHWLEKLQMTDLSRVVDDPAVWAPIHRIAGTLDKALPELFAPDYDRRLEAARQRLRPDD